MTKIGIDFSMNSTAMSIEQDGIVYFYNFSKGLPKNKTEELGKYNINVIKMESETSIDFSENENLKLEYAIRLSDEIMKVIESFGQSEVAIENFAYSMVGRSTLDISGYQYILRYNLRNSKNVQNIYYFQPSEIKKFALKGNSNKNQLILQYIQNAYVNNLSELLNSENLFKKKGKDEFGKPIDDLVDSFFILQYLKSKYV